MAANERGDRSARIVHVRLGERERDQAARDSDLGDEGVFFARPQAAVVARGQKRDDVGTDVVPSPGILVSRVAEADDEEIG
jgi:hypothetical protein